MEQEDYLKRQIDQLGRVLGKILSDLCGSKSKGLISSGIDTANHDLKNELDLDTSFLVSIPASKLIDTLQQRNEMTVQNLDRLADILFTIAEGMDQPLDGNENSRRLFERALIIYKYVDQSGPTYSFDRHFKMEIIERILLHCT
jgi:hypothetical protein